MQLVFSYLTQRLNADYQGWFERPWFFIAVLT